MIEQRYHGQLSVTGNTTGQTVAANVAELLTQWDTKFPVRQERGTIRDVSSTYG
ncbi:hypothetical protein LCGC14_3116750, partial [marine sediment metagenome]